MCAKLLKYNHNKHSPFAAEADRQIASSAKQKKAFHFPSKNASMNCDFISFAKFWPFYELESILNLFFIRLVCIMQSERSLSQFQ